MGLAIFIIVLLGLLVLLSPLLYHKKIWPWALTVAIVTSVVITANSTYTTCEDGWASRSIGTQGACSWHGGVVTKLNDFGWTVLIITLVILGGAYIFISYKARHDDSELQNSKVNESETK